MKVRVSLKGVTKEITCEGSIADLALAVAKEFKLKAGVRLSGGFPPKALAPSAILTDVVVEGELLRAVADEPKEAALKKPVAKKKPAVKKKPPAKKEEEEELPADTPADVAPARKRRRGVKLNSEGGIAEQLAGAAAGTADTGSLFFRAALRGAMKGRHDDLKAEDRYAAALSGEFEMTVAERSLAGDPATLLACFDVDIARRGKTRRGARRHEDRVEALSREMTLSAVRAAYADESDREMLAATNMARCSPRVFWSLVYHSEGKGVDAALEALLPDLDWDRIASNRRRRTTRSSQEAGDEVEEGGEEAEGKEKVVVQPPPNLERRQMMAAAAEKRAAALTTTAPLPPAPAPPPTPTNAAERALLAVVGGDASVVALLLTANVSTPRDLAAWADSADILRDLIQAPAVNASSPNAESLAEWARIAQKLIQSNPTLQDSFAPLLLS